MARALLPRVRAPERAFVQVDSVTVPAESGDMGVLPGHMPSVARLRPGVMTVNTTDSDIKKYFVASGYVMVHPTSVADVTAIEAVPVEQLDAEAAKKGLQKFKYVGKCSCPQGSQQQPPQHFAAARRSAAACSASLLARCGRLSLRLSAPVKSAIVFGCILIGRRRLQMLRRQSLRNVRRRIR